ncbi:dihydrofolate reductase [Nocardioides sp. cx-169]|uniref:dihydrofolate reductase n=1 Tax=Nocardioides sp. cx-169 TaxID=2899080 RepID=UPI001E2E6F52|nr:dihydrofolate reductase [Nocardioides sp. cx-169]MCD4535575.1 dihydrofolate reductase [Nocardioides sp. cx-169]
MTPGGKRVVMVAAVADNGVIGVDGDIPWRIPEDFAHFKRTTLGHTLVMGRATYDSIGRPLPGRTTVVLTRDPSWSADGVLVAPSLPFALELADRLDGDVMVVGGALVYAEAMPLADEQVLTEVHLTPDGDTFYPEFDRHAWLERRRDTFPDRDVVWLSRA